MLAVGEDATNIELAHLLGSQPTKNSFEAVVGSLDARWPQFLATPFQVGVAQLGDGIVVVEQPELGALGAGPQLIQDAAGGIEDSAQLLLDTTATDAKIRVVTFPPRAGDHPVRQLAFPRHGGSFLEKPR